MKKRKVWIILLIVFGIFVLRAEGYLPFLLFNEKVNDIPFGINFNLVSDAQEYCRTPAKRGYYIRYIRENEDRNFMGLDFDQIEYVTLNDIFYGMDMSIKGNVNYAKLNNALRNQYGDPDKTVEGKEVRNYYWNDESVQVSSQYNIQEKWFTVRIDSRQILNQSFMAKLSKLNPTSGRLYQDACGDIEGKDSIGNQFAVN